jgi:hypothetical protein
MNGNLFGVVCLLMIEESQIRENLYCVDMKIKFEYCLFKCEILYYQQLQSDWSKLHAVPIYWTMFILFLFSFVKMDFLLLQMWHAVTTYQQNSHCTCCLQFHCDAS